MKKRSAEIWLILFFLGSASGSIEAATSEKLDEYTLDTVVVEADRAKNKFGDIVPSSPITARAATSTSSPAKTSRSVTMSI